MSTSLLSQAAPSYAPPSPPRSPGLRQRIASLDIVRGVVVVLMAIDHVRVYSGQPAGGPTPGIFFTRWITHFVAPAFLFLAGTGAYLYGQRVQDRGKLARFLVTRGLWLVFLELTVLRVAWTFNFDFAHYMLAGVIWMIGWCMVLMAGIVYLPMRRDRDARRRDHRCCTTSPTCSRRSSPAMRQRRALAAVEDSLRRRRHQLGANGPPLVILFVLVPWIGVMAAGYAFGSVMTLRAASAGAATAAFILCALGVSAIATAAFILLRGAIDVYGDPRPAVARNDRAARRDAEGARLPRRRTSIRRRCRFCS